MLKYNDQFTEEFIQRIVKDLAKTHKVNLFSHVLELMKRSKLRYKLCLKNDTSEVKNLNNMPDERLSFLRYGKTRAYLPPVGYDGYVQIGVKAQYVDQETKTKKVNIINIIFHELFECFLMTDQGMQYKEAHNYLMGVEEDFIEQFPGLSEYPASGKLIRP